jgi:YidC/Oxa1 family membrane protein insertase
MEKNTLIGLTLIGAVLVGFSLFNRPSEEQRARMQHYQDSIQAVQLKNEVAKEEARQMESLEASTDSASQLFASAQGTEQFYTLKNKLVELTFTNKGGRIYAAKLFDYNGQDGQPVVLFDNKDAGMSFDFSGKNENIITENLYFNAVESNDSTLVMRLQTASAGYIDFCYRLQRDAYMVNFTLQAHGMQNFFAPSVHSVDIRWNQDARQLEKGYSFENRYTTLTYKKKGKGTDYLSETRDADKEIEEKLDWVAFKNQFFSSVFIADEDFTDVHLTSNMQKEGSGYLKEYKADMTTFFDPTGQKATNMQFYFGPNHYKILQRTNHLATSDKDLDMQRLVYLGWPLFRWINRFFTIYIFDWLTNWGLSMGVVLLLMTIVLKLLVYPTTYKSYMSSAKMRVLKPYVDEINKKYPNKEDAMKKQQEIMGVYSKYGVSPMGGCLPMLIQMPVFIAMFNFVPNAIELRGQSFLWAPDLSTYDDVINWGFNIPLLGDHLSLFCLLFSATNILNTMYMMKQQNQAAQEQMPGMKWMMYLMPVMFIFIFNNYSAGLNYYYFISGLISIIIMAVLRKTTDDKALLAKLEARAAANKNNPSKRSNMMAKLEALQKEQERIQKEREARLKR